MVEHNAAAGENIDLMTTILSRFDLIFIVRDIRDEERDKAICRHVMGIHVNSKADSANGGAGKGIGIKSGGSDGGLLLTDGDGKSGESSASSAQSIGENAAR